MPNHAAIALDPYPTKLPSVAMLSSTETAALERLFPSKTPDIWRDIALSQFAALSSMLGHVLSNEQIATVAFRTMQSVVSHIGGNQPYIPKGRWVLSDALANKIIALRNQGTPYEVIARDLNITERYVREIEADWVAAERAARQGKLDL